MANLGNYDASNGDTMDTRDVIPAGEYVAALVKSEKKDAKTQGNAYINCEFEITDGPLQGRRFWTILNLWNSNQQAVDIAQRELNSIMHACGKLRIQDTEELHGIPMLVKLKVKQDDQYGPQNATAGYKPLNGAGAGGGGGSFADQNQGRPWNNNAA